MTAKSDFERMLRTLTSFWVSKAIYSVSKLGIPDLLGDHSMPIEELAAQSGAHPRALYRTMRALAGEGVFVEEPGPSFRLTALGSLLRSDSERSMKHAAIMYGEEIYDTWGRFLDVVRTEEPAWEAEHGADYFGYLRATPAAANTFNRAMGELGSTMYGDRAIAEAFQFGSFGRIADVGGGRGGLLAAILAKHPNTHGVLFELPHVIEEAKRAHADLIANGRLAFVAGDFFEEICRDAGLYLLKRVLHDWDDESAVNILSGCRRAMDEESRVLVIEFLLPPPNTSSFANLLDLHMMTILGGFERRLEEYERLFERAELRLLRVHSTESALSIIEASCV